MARRGVKVVAMEASSHGLALKRIDAVDFNTVSYTHLPKPSAENNTFSVVSYSTMTSGQ